MGTRRTRQRTIPAQDEGCQLSKQMPAVLQVCCSRSGHEVTLKLLAVLASSSRLLRNAVGVRANSMGFELQFRVLKQHHCLSFALLLGVDCTVPLAGEAVQRRISVLSAASTCRAPKRPCDTAMPSQYFYSSVACANQHLQSADHANMSAMQAQVYLQQHAAELLRHVAAAYTVATNAAALEQHTEHPEQHPASAALAQARIICRLAGQQGLTQQAAAILSIPRMPRDIAGLALQAGLQLTTVQLVARIEGLEEWGHCAILLPGGLCSTGGAFLQAGAC
jgi:hypothetical protein